VAGESGPLRGGTTWSAIAKAAGLPEGYCELTTATKKVRRVGIFDPRLVKKAIEANNPTRIVMNHFDYVAPLDSIRGRRFLKKVERSIGREIDWLGTGPDTLVERTKSGTRDS